jgi:hypothetical protein
VAANVTATTATTAAGVATIPGHHVHSSVMNSFTPNTIIDLTECHILSKQVRYVHRPKIYFARNLSSPAAVNAAGIVATGAGPDVVLSTAHLAMTLHEIDYLLQGCSASLEGTLTFLFQQLIYVTLYALDHLSLAPIIQEIPEMMEQLESLQQLMIRYADRLTTTFTTKGLSSGKELAYCQYLLRWSEEVAYRLQRFLGVDVNPHPETPVVAGERLVKKR